MTKNSFILYTEYMENIEMLNMEQRGILLTALMSYQMQTDLPEMDAVTKMCFSFVKARIDRDNESYDEKCRKNAENGAKGGRPKKANGSSKKRTVSKKSERFFEKPKKADTDTDNEPDNDLKEKDVSNDTSKKKAPEKIAFGEFQNVKLTMDEYARLANDYGETMRKDCIAFLDEYIGEKNYKSNSHYLAIRRWVVNAVKDQTARRKRGDPKDGYDAIRNFAKGGNDDATGVFPDFSANEIDIPERESFSG